MIARAYKFIEGWAFDSFYVALGIFMLEVFYMWLKLPVLLELSVDAIIFYWPLWGPLILLFVFWSFWKEYIQRLFRMEQGYVLLEFKLPREQVRSPAAMEIVLTTLHNSGGEATFIFRNWQGKMRPEWSLEIVSIEGEVHFYIHCREALRFVVENQMYAQFPGIEINEVPDYSRLVDFDVDTMSLWGVEYKYTKADPYPIKSYIDFGLDRDPKEEFKIDPMTALIEQIAAAGKGENYWLQIIIRAKKDDYVPGLIGIKKHSKMKMEADESIDALLEKARDLTGKADFNKLTQAQKQAITNIERALSKRVFEVGIRTMYFAKNEDFVGTRIPTLINFWAPVSPTEAVEYNTLRPARWHIKYDYPWQDFRDIRKRRDRVKLFDAYRRRSYFAAPYKQVPMQMTTEELATIFHFPGEVLQTPSLERVPSKRSGAPANLPV